MRIYGAGVVPALRVDDQLDVVVVGLLVEDRVEDRDEVVVVDLRVDVRVAVRVSVRSVLVVVSGTRVVGATPTVISAEPRPCCPSMPMTI